MHLHSSEVSARRVLHSLWASHIADSSMTMFLFTLIVLTQEVLMDIDDDDDDDDEMSQDIDDFIFYFIITRSYVKELELHRIAKFTFCDAILSF